LSKQHKRKDIKAN